MGIAANSWLAHMDQFLSLPKNDEEGPKLQIVLQSLVDTYYDAVDAEKSGEQVFVKEHDRAKRWPHFMERASAGKWIVQETYHSTTILGKIYDMVKGECDSDDFSWKPPGEIVMERRFEYKGFSEHYGIWTKHYSNYRHKIRKLMEDSISEDRNAQIEALLKIYVEEFDKPDSVSQSEMQLDDQYKKASAIYAIVYTAAQKKLESLQCNLTGQDLPQLGLQFVWKVAGHVLCQMYIESDKGKPILVSEALLKEMKLVRRHSRHEAM